MQLPLLPDGPIRRGCETRAPLDDRSARLLEQYRDTRLAQGAHERSVAREVSQLRSLAREAGDGTTPADLRTLVGDPLLAAQALSEPRTPISRSTGLARLNALQRLLQI